MSIPTARRNESAFASLAFFALAANFEKRFFLENKDQNIPIPKSVYPIYEGSVPGSLFTERIVPNSSWS